MFCNGCGNEASQSEQLFCGKTLILLKKKKKKIPKPKEQKKKLKCQVTSEIKKLCFSSGVRNMYCDISQL